MQKLLVLIEKVNKNYRLPDKCHDIIHRFKCQDIVHKRSLTIE